MAHPVFARSIIHMQRLGRGRRRSVQECAVTMAVRGVAEDLSRGAVGRGVSRAWAVDRLYSVL